MTEARCDPNVRSKNRWTPLHKASRLAEYFSFLLENVGHVIAEHISAVQPNPGCILATCRSWLGMSICYAEQYNCTLMHMHQTWLARGKICGCTFLVLKMLYDVPF